MSVICPGLPAVPPPAVEVVVVDDARPWRLLTRELLATRGFTVVGEADCAAAALELIERRVPDAALLDVHLPDGDGFELTAHLIAGHPRLAVLLTSVASDRCFYTRAWACGARGFVPKSALAHVELTRFWPCPETAE